MTLTLLTIGASYTLMGLPVLLERILALTLKPIQRQIHYVLFACGLLNVIAGFLSIAIPTIGWYAVLLISQLLLAGFMLRTIKTLIQERP
ncbi:hypothetical protein RKD55_004566 [Rossellomorea marisflavi]